MSAQQPYEPADPRKAVAQSVRSKLQKLFEERGRRASDDLEFIFEIAAGLSLSNMQDRPVVTTELLLVAIAQRGADPRSLPEGKRIVAYAAILHHNEQFRNFLSRVPSFHNVEFARHLLPVALSPNVERALDMACDTNLDADAKSDDFVTVRHFLAVFPPPGSVAARLLTTMGIDIEELQAAAIGPDSQFEGPSTLEEISAEAEPPPGARRKGAASKKKEDRSQAKPRLTDRPNERVAIHSDEPAEIDELGRRSFAELLGQRIREAKASGNQGDPSGAFMVHLHGPWGAGKSSVLNFLEKDLTRGPDPWVVVRFNAWRDQRLQPPWWSLISSIYSGARPRLDRQAARRLWRRWLWWRVKADFVPWLVVVGCLFLLAGLIWLERASSLEQLLATVIGAITLAGALIIGSRSLALGSQRAAQAYADLKNDPYRPIARLFDSLVAAVDRPLAVFVDDLDRCEGKYVVDLLEGIQTLMRGAPVTYVVAADRKWICSSFEQRYAAFSPPIGEAGRPLGYLFLDKIFQISAGLPQPTAEVSNSYWSQLLNSGGHDLRRVEEERLKAEKEAATKAASLTRQEDLQALITQAENSGDAQEILATRAAAAKRIASEDAATNTEHRLQPFAPLLEPNPRAMKRLVNAYGMHQATQFLAGRTTSSAALARWTILELRWPLLADFLAYRPDYTERLRKRLSEKDQSEVPNSLRELFGDELVVKVLGPANAGDRLTGAAVKSILGAVQGER